MKKIFFLLIVFGAHYQVDAQVIIANALNSNLEGGEIKLMNSNANYNPWQIDNYAGMFRLHHSGAAPFVMASNGNLGLGTWSPTSPLHIANSNAVIKLQNTTHEDTEDGFYGWLGGYDKSGDEVWWIGEGGTGSKTLGFHTYRDGYDLSIYNKGKGITIKNSGNIGIGTKTPDSKLTVKGKIHAEEVKIDLSVPAPDYVFKKDYDLLSIEEVQEHIKAQGHLPNIPSAKELEANGVELGVMNMKLLEKIEELTLYTINQEERIEALEKQNSEIKDIQDKLNQLLNNKNK